MRQLMLKKNIGNPARMVGQYPPKTAIPNATIPIHPGTKQRGIHAIVNIMHGVCGRMEYAL